MSSQPDSSASLMANNGAYTFYDASLGTNVVIEDETPPNICVTCMKTLCMIIFGLIFIPIILVVIIVYLLLWVCTGFGYCYEKYAEKRDRQKYSPSSENLKPWGPNGEIVHVVHINGGNNADKTVPPVLYVSGLGASMYIVESLLKDLAQNFGKSIELVSVDSPGYGYSQIPKSWEEESPNTQITLLRNVVRELNLRKPYIVFGASAGATLAQLYRLLFPEEVCACVLYDPTPSNVLEEGSPFRDEFSKAPDIYKTMATCSKLGMLRPTLPLFSLLPGEFGEIFRKLPPGHLAVFMTNNVLLKTGNHFRYWPLIMKEATILANEYQNNPEKKNSNNGQKVLNTPLLVVGALAWKQGHGGVNKKQVSVWWRENQQALVKTSNKNCYVARTDYDHGACMLDMKLASNCIKTVLAQINN